MFKNFFSKQNVGENQVFFSKSVDFLKDRLSRFLIESGDSEDTWDELFEMLISWDVGFVTSERLLETIKERLKSKQFNRLDIIKELKNEIQDLLFFENKIVFERSQDSSMVILMVGINGSGKTTSVAKIANLFSNQNYKVLISAADTFRAAAVDQMKAWGDSLGIEVIGGNQGSDSGAVVFDSMEAANARKSSVVIVDTSGRLHTKTNLMDELKKIYRIISRYKKSEEVKVILTIDAGIGQNSLLQASSFLQSIPCDGVFLSKLDGTSKGGIVIAIAQELNLPVLFMGTGEDVSDISQFDSELFVSSLFGEIEL
ncbi:MAG: signal recognition particle-docking protein FtsY [SAR202 cluster bacterium]|nr:signal recognition particle-docking protein FtsY [SAR202 cluster bacterium]|tara:strand:+ start:4261 stop:5202 length:942 start_codon:yes stop_codon:yes gene_type:complete